MFACSGKGAWTCYSSKHYWLIEETHKQGLQNSDGEREWNEWRGMKGIYGQHLTDQKSHHVYPSPPSTSHLDLSKEHLGFSHVL